MTNIEIENDGAVQNLQLTQDVNAPIERVWRAWTEPEEVKRWWGPKTFTCPHSEIDLRVGGKYLHCMRSADGTDYWSTGLYREVVPGEKIVYTDCFADDQGNVVPAAHYGFDESYPLEMLVTVTFKSFGGSTTLTLQHTGVDRLSETDRASMEQGWRESFHKLETSIRSSH